MTTELAKMITSGGGIIAVIAVVMIFTDFIAKERAASSLERAKSMEIMNELHRAHLETSLQIATAIKDASIANGAAYGQLVQFCKEKH